MYFLAAQKRKTLDARHGLHGKLEERKIGTANVLSIDLAP
jgi:hypothetical protein